MATPNPSPTGLLLGLLLSGLLSLVSLWQALTKDSSSQIAALQLRVEKIAEDVAFMRGKLEHRP
jgi:hypothetical protein